MPSSPGPEAVYKYLGFQPNKRQDPRLRQLFAQNAVFFASPESFNDPFDCKANVRFVGSLDDRKRKLDAFARREIPHLKGKARQLWIKGKLEEGIFATEEHRQQYQKVLQEAINRVGVYCVSSTPQNILMWSHYSNEHTGLCLEFRQVSDTPFFEEPSCSNLFPVVYSNEFPQVTELNVAEILPSLIKTKATDWAYEGELRFIDFEGGGLRHFKPENLTKVIFGHKSSSRNIRKVRGWIAEGSARPKLVQASLASDQYRLNICPLES